MQQQWKDLLAENEFFTILGLTLALMGLLLILLLQWRRAKKRSEKLSYTQRVLHLIQPEAGLENNLNLVLEVIGSIVDTHGYAFYIQDSKSNYILKAVRHKRRDPGQVAPSYSGLAPYEKEEYLPPLSVKTDGSLPDIGFIREGEVPLFQLTLSGGKGLIRLGPIAKMQKRRMDLLLYTGELLPQILDVLIESERLKIKAEVIETSSVALHTVSAMANDSETVIRKAFGMASSALGMSGGCLLASEAGNVSILSLFGWSKEVERRLSDSSNVSMLIQLIGTQDISVWNDSDSVFERAVSVLGNRKDRFMMVGRLPYKGKKAWFVCGFPPNPASDLSPEQILTSMGMMVRELNLLLGIQNDVKAFGHTYSDFLKKLAGAIDDLNPYTVGYSEMTSRYAVIIAKEMGLPLKQIRNIGIAAHLSNIGVLGLSEDLYLKEGKFTEVEFEKMKLHAEVGAAIVEMTIGDQEVADYIRYHHERIDGNGYPAGLRGEEIPVGARIISVVQTFLAKINGRKYRDPLQFEKAVQLIESLAGAQLDEQAVKAFTGWLHKKRSTASKGKSLGPCWEMCCAPAEVCRTCPAFNKPQTPCWEASRNNCQAHGKSCETCFVYTETKTRSGVG